MNGAKKLTRPIESEARHSRLNCGTSTSAPARNVSTIPANEPTKLSQLGTTRWKALPTTTPRKSSINATETPISTETVEASTIVPARSAAIAMSLTGLYLPSLVEAIGSVRAVNRGPHPESTTDIEPLADLPATPPRRGSADDQREVGRREQEADPLGAAPAGHRERRADAVHRDEAELAGRVGVAAAGDQHRAEPADARRRRRSRLTNGSSGCTGVPGAVGGDRALVGERRALGLAERVAVAGACAGRRRARGRASASGPGSGAGSRGAGSPCRPARTGKAFRQSRSASPRPR